MLHIGSLTLSKAYFENTPLSRTTFLFATLSL